ncbi:MAG TPA: glycosyltransferase [Planctomycetota bacterium]
MISFILPAYNEEAMVGAAVDSIQAAARDCGQPFEIIVVNDASADRTAEIAHAHGARVIDVHKRQIAAVRNAGAREAEGDIFVFLDADSILPPEVLRAALDALADGAIGGGAFVDFDFRPGFFQRVFVRVFTFFYFQVARWAAGCFIFVKRDAFQAINGFDERYFASEEIHLSRALKRQGRFVLLKAPVITSGRKLKRYSPLGMAGIFLRLGIQGRAGVQKREGLELWYDGKREQ